MGLRKERFQNVMQELLVTVGMLAVATVIAFSIFNISSRSTGNIAIIYVLALILISRYTRGYWYGFCSSLFCVMGVNYWFTYPYFRFNFTLTGYPITFIMLLIITIITSTTTSIMTRQADMLKQREKQLMDAEKERMRANLLRAMSHDIRTPLTSIIVASDSYREHPEQYSLPETAQLFEHIGEDAEWLLHMVENLLSVTRIDSDNLGVTKSEEPVEEIVEEAVARVKKRIPSAQITVTLPEEFVMVKVDPLLIEQVLINLLENAIVHGGSAEPVWLKVCYEKERVVFHVRDYGVGIEEEKMKDLINGTLLSGEYSSESKKGMGIGLSICRTIMDAHNGTLQAINHGDGAEFLAAIPIEETEKEGEKNGK